MSILDHITFILVRPQMGENIGAAARAMANFGMRDLRLVSPRDGWPNERAEAMSSGAFGHMRDVQVFDSLADALADITHSFATTARPRHMVKPVDTPREASLSAVEAVCASLETDAEAKAKVAFVFGAERTGLENDEVGLCQRIVQAQTNPDFSSLNLGQCVLMMAYELFETASQQVVSSGEKSDTIQPDFIAPAPQEEFENLFGRLEAALDAGGFFRDEGLRPTVTRNLRTTLLRAGMTSQEVKTFHGVLRALVNPR